jgi:transporter family-2 protein
MRADIIMLVGLAAVAGAAITLQGQFMGLMNAHMGPLESLFITYGGGGFLAALLTLAAKGGNLAAWRNTPAYALSAGLLGLLIVGIIGFAVPRMGVARAFPVIVTFQLVVAALIDHFGWFQAVGRPLGFEQLLGMGLLFGGTWLVLR